MLFIFLHRLLADVLVSTWECVEMFGYSREKDDLRSLSHPVEYVGHDPILNALFGPHAGIPLFLDLCGLGVGARFLCSRQQRHYTRYAVFVIEIIDVRTRTKSYVTELEGRSLDWTRACSYRIDESGKRTTVKWIWLRKLTVSCNDLTISLSANAIRF